MKPRRGERDYDYLQRVLRAVLDVVPSAIIVAGQRDGSVLMVAGGARDSRMPGENALQAHQRREELIAAAPGAIQLWAHERGLVAEEEVH